MCVADASGRPRCVTCSCNVSDPRKANRVCSENLQPMTLCGTDGKTYQHYGSLRKEMCKIKKFIDVDHLGACKGNRHNTLSICWLAQIISSEVNVIFRLSANRVCLHARV